MTRPEVPRYTVCCASYYSDADNPDYADYFSLAVIDTRTDDLVESKVWAAEDASTMDEISDYCVERAKHYGSKLALVRESTLAEFCECCGELNVRAIKRADWIRQVNAN